jgi:hypothetical protein
MSPMADIAAHARVAAKGRSSGLQWGWNGNDIGVVRPFDLEPRGGARLQFGAAAATPLSDCS